MKFKILVVDDERDNRDLLKGLLEAQGFAAALAESAEEALLRASESRPDLVLCDVAMAGLSGFDLCRRLKEDPRTAGIPVIMMSGAQKAQRDQAEGIELGADDYLLKPFTPRLMLAKVRGVLRRYAAGPDPREALVKFGLTIDLQARLVRNGRQKLTLTRKEFDLLTTFLSKCGRVLSARFLLESVWGYDPAVETNTHTVETHISSLRRKLGPKLGKRIVSVSGLGYRLDAE